VVFAMSFRQPDGRTRYFLDSNHVSAAGAARIYQTFAADFAWVFEGRAIGRYSADKRILDLLQARARPLRHPRGGLTIGLKSASDDAY
jgi:hypothetical protein